MKTIDEIRSAYDVLDREIVKHLEKRFELSAYMGKVKESQNLEIYDLQREGQVLESLQNQLENKDFYPYIQKIYDSIFQASKEIQRAGKL